MPNVNASFQGNTLIIPGAYYADDPNAVLSAPAPNTPPLVFLGYAYGQQPKVPVTYNTPQALISAIRGGPCSGFVPFLTSPSGQLKGAQQITLINVATATQSSLTLSAGVTGVINLTSADYGLPSNQLQITVQAGSIAGKNITFYDAFANRSSSPGINLGVPFQLAYTGAATGGVSYTIATSGGVATTFTLTSPTAGESATVSLLPSNYATVESLVGFINGTGHFNAFVLSNGSLPSSNLDSATTVALTAPSGGVNQYVNVYATLGDIVYWMNTFASGFATGVVANGVTSSSGLAPTNIGYTLFSGATSTQPTLSDYASGFNVALAIPGWAVFADNNASGIVALGTQHAATASNVANGRWRRFFSGSSIGDSVSTATAAAQAQNAITTTYVYPGIYRTSPTTGLNTLYAGLYAAAAAAGMATGNPSATPLTNKALTGNGAELNLSQAQINTLQQSGVMPLWVSPQTGLPTFVSDLTTWQNDSNPENVFNQQVACRWALAYAMTTALQPYAGTIAAPLTETLILNAVKAALNAAVYSPNNAGGVISSWDTSSLQLVYTGATQTAAISVSVALVGQNRFITMYVPLQPLNITITAGVQGQSGGTPV